MVLPEISVVTGFSKVGVVEARVLVPLRIIAERARDAIRGLNFIRFYYSLQ